jgi:DNA-binding SARP family transcriptional activator/TolB-like protein
LMANTSRSSALAARPQPRLRIEVIGACKFIFDGREIDLQSRKARALVAALALSDDWKQPRETFHGLLWGGSDADKARASCRNAVYDIQKAFSAAGCQAFLADKQTLAIHRNLAEVDIWEAFDAARNGNVLPCLLERDRATELLLSDLETVDDSFHDWLIAKRQSLHSRLMAALEDALRQQQSDGGSTRAEALARSLIKLDPTHEEAVRAVIRARAGAGDLGGAFTIYKTLWDLLDNEFEIPPSKETRDLIAELRLQQPEPQALSGPSGLLAAPSSPAMSSVAQLVPPPGPPVAPRKLILNVGGFDVTGVRPEHRYLINGFRQELSACLVRFREWSVRDQAHTPAGAVRPDPRDGEYTIDASAFEASEGVRLVLMLRDAVTNDYVWSERLQLSIPTWFEAQQQIVRRLATALNVNISAERVAAQSRLPHENYGAYDLWLKAQVLHYSFDSREMDQSVAIYRQLTSDYPTFAPAYVGLANYLNIVHISHPGVPRSRDRTAEALQVARQAVRLDPVNSRAQLCLAWSHVMAMQPNEAQLAASSAYELNENDSWTRASSLSCRSMSGLAEALRPELERLVRQEQLIAPLQWAYHGTSLFLAGNYEACVHAAECAGSSYHMLHAWKASALAYMGKPAEADIAMNAFVSAIRQRWALAEPPSNASIARWFLRAHPICRADDWHRLRHGLELAGLEGTSPDDARWNEQIGEG